MLLDNDLFITPGTNLTKWSCKLITKIETNATRSFYYARNDAK